MLDSTRNVSKKIAGALLVHHHRMLHAEYLFRKFVVATLLSVHLQAFAATITWSGAGDGVSWSDANNWFGNVRPFITDTAALLPNSAGKQSIYVSIKSTVLVDKVVIGDEAGNTTTQLTILSGGILKVSASTNALDVRASATVVLNSGGELGGNGLMVIRGHLEWRGGLLSASRDNVELQVESNGVILINSPTNVTLQRRQLTVESGGVISWNSGNVVVTNRGYVRILTGGQWQVDTNTNTTTVPQIMGSFTVDTAGTFSVISTASQTPLVNTVMLRLNGGTLSISEGVNITVANITTANQTVGGELHVEGADSALTIGGTLDSLKGLRLSGNGAVRLSAVVGSLSVTSISYNVKVDVSNGADVVFTLLPTNDDTNFAWNGSLSIWGSNTVGTIDCGNAGGKITIQKLLLNAEGRLATTQSVDAIAVDTAILDGHVSIALPQMDIHGSLNISGEGEAQFLTPYVIVNVHEGAYAGWQLSSQSTLSFTNGTLYVADGAQLSIFGSNANGTVSGADFLLDGTMAVNEAVTLVLENTTRLVQRKATSEVSVAGGAAVVVRSADQSVLNGSLVSTISGNTRALMLLEEGSQMVIGGKVLFANGDWWIEKAAVVMLTSSDNDESFAEFGTIRQAGGSEVRIECSGAVEYLVRVYQWDVIDSDVESAVVAVHSGFATMLINSTNVLLDSGDTAIVLAGALGVVLSGTAQSRWEVRHESATIWSIEDVDTTLSIGRDASVRVIVNANEAQVVEGGGEFSNYGRLRFETDSEESVNTSFGVQLWNAAGASIEISGGSTLDVSSGLESIGEITVEAEGELLFSNDSADAQLILAGTFLGNGTIAIMQTYAAQCGGQWNAYGGILRLEESNVELLSNIIFGGRLVMNSAILNLGERKNLTIAKGGYATWSGGVIFGDESALVVEGALSVQSSGTAAMNCCIIVSNDGILDLLSGNLTLQDGAHLHILPGGLFNISAPKFELNASASETSSILVEAGSQIVISSTGQLGLLCTVQGSITLLSGADLEVYTLYLQTRAVVTGSGCVRVSKHLQWDSGTIADHAELHILEAITTALLSSNVSRVVCNNSAVVHFGNSSLDNFVVFGLANGGTIVNELGGTLWLSAGKTISFGDVPGWSGTNALSTVVNRGTFVVDTGSQVSFSGNTQFILQASQLVLASDSAVRCGAASTFVLSGGTLRANGPTPATVDCPFLLWQGGELSGPVSLKFVSEITIDAGGGSVVWSDSGSIDISAGQLLRWRSGGLTFRGVDNASIVLSISNGGQFAMAGSDGVATATAIDNTRVTLHLTESGQWTVDSGQFALDTPIAVQHNGPIRCRGGAVVSFSEIVSASTASILSGDCTFRIADTWQWRNGRLTDGPSVNALAAAQLAISGNVSLEKATLTLQEGATAAVSEAWVTINQSEWAIREGAVMILRENTKFIDNTTGVSRVINNGTLSVQTGAMVSMATTLGCYSNGRVVVEAGGKMLLSRLANISENCTLQGNGTLVLCSDTSNTGAVLSITSSGIIDMPNGTLELCDSAAVEMAPSNVHSVGALVIRFDHELSESVTISQRYLSDNTSEAMNMSRHDNTTEPRFALRSMTFLSERPRGILLSGIEVHVIENTETTVLKESTIAMASGAVVLQRNASMKLFPGNILRIASSLSLQADRAGGVAIDNGSVLIVEPFVQLNATTGSLALYGTSAQLVVQEHALLTFHGNGTQPIGGQLLLSAANSTLAIDAGGYLEIGSGGSLVGFGSVVGSVLCDNGGVISVNGTPTAANRVLAIYGTLRVAVGGTVQLAIGAGDSLNATGHWVAALAVDGDVSFEPSAKRTNGAAVIAVTVADGVVPNRTEQFELITWTGQRVGEPRVEVIGNSPAGPLVIDKLLFGPNGLVVSMKVSCPYECNGRGRCHGNDCECDAGWSGDDCSVKNTPSSSSSTTARPRHRHSSATDSDSMSGPLLLIAIIVPIGTVALLAAAIVAVILIRRKRCRDRSTKYSKKTFERDEEHALPLSPIAIRTTPVLPPITVTSPRSSSVSPSTSATTATNPPTGSGRARRETAPPAVGTGNSGPFLMPPSTTGAPSSGGVSPEPTPRTPGVENYALRQLIDTGRRLLAEDRTKQEKARNVLGDSPPAEAPSSTSEKPTEPSTETDDSTPLRTLQDELRELRAAAAAARKKREAMEAMEKKEKNVEQTNTTEEIANPLFAHPNEVPMAQPLLPRQPKGRQSPTSPTSPRIIKSDTPQRTEGNATATQPTPRGMPPNVREGRNSPTVRETTAHKSMVSPTPRRTELAEKQKTYVPQRSNRDITSESADSGEEESTPRTTVPLPTARDTVTASPSQQIPAARRPIVRPIPPLILTSQHHPSRAVPPKT